MGAEAVFYLFLVRVSYGEKNADRATSRANGRVSIWPFAWIFIHTGLSAIYRRCLIVFPFGNQGEVIF